MNELEALRTVYQTALALRKTAPVDDDFPEMMHNFDSALLAVEKLTTKGGWLDFESAPTEKGSRAIVFAPSIFEGEKGTVGEAFVGRDGEWYWAGCDDEYHDPIPESNTPPTKWQPLPETP